MAWDRAKGKVWHRFAASMRQKEKNYLFHVFWIGNASRGLELENKNPSLIFVSQTLQTPSVEAKLLALV